MANYPPLLEDKKTDYFWVDCRKLDEEEGYNERERWGDLEGLADEIAAQGVKDVLVVNKRGDRYVVKSGHRRRRACLILLDRGLPPFRVPVILERKGASPEQRILDQITDNSGLPFTPWEQAKIMGRLRNFGWEPKDIAEKWGRSAVYVRRLLSLYDAPQRLINLVREGRLSATQAMDSIAKGEIDQVIALAEANKLGPDVELELFPAEVSTRNDKITQRDIRPNSWKVFKKWVPNVDREKIAPEKLVVLEFLERMAKGELTEKDFKKFFK